MKNKHEAKEGKRHEMKERARYKGGKQMAKDCEYKKKGKK